MRGEALRMESGWDRRVAIWTHGRGSAWQLGQLGGQLDGGASTQAQLACN